MSGDSLIDSFFTLSSTLANMGDAPPPHPLRRLFLILRVVKVQGTVRNLPEVTSGSITRCIEASNDT